jgi:hypothetical protein
VKADDALDAYRAELKRRFPYADPESALMEQLPPYPISRRPRILVEHDHGTETRRSN